MSYNEFFNELRDKGISVKQDSPIAPHTTFRIGGKADFLCIVNTIPQLHDVIIICQTYRIPCKIIGGGSNILVSDKGVRGMIVINKAKGWEILGNAKIPKLISKTSHRHEAEDSIQPLKTGQEKVLVRVASGVKIPALMNALFAENISGLELFAGIPATVGGAVYMNMHGGRLFFGDLIAQGQILSDSEVRNVPQSYFQFDYDYSILHETDETLLSCDLVLTKGQSNEAKSLARKWIQQKKVQPQRSAGCIFHNLTSEDQSRLGYPTPSVGYLIDKVLKMKGKTVGDAKISETHAAFIENIGNATAINVLQLINEIKKQAIIQTGIVLKTEVEFVGEM